MSSTPHTELPQTAAPAPSTDAAKTRYFWVFLYFSPAAVSLPPPDGLAWQAPHALPVFCAYSGLAVAVLTVPPIMTLTKAKVAIAEPIPNRVDLNDIAIPSMCENSPSTSVEIYSAKIALRG